MSSSFQKKTTQALDNLLHENRTFPPPHEFSREAHIKSQEEYLKMYERSIRDSDNFWLEQARTLDWIKKPSIACKYFWNTEAKKAEHTWFEDGVLNASYNCLDRHANGPNGSKIALIWQGEIDFNVQKITYRQLHQDVCKFANVLKGLGVGKGDRVCIYLPMIPELVVCMLACARIGAIHSVVFGGFSASSLSDRINDSSCKILITSDKSSRGGKPILFKEIANQALEKTPCIEKVIVIRKSRDYCDFSPKRDLWYHQLMSDANVNCPPEPMRAEDKLFILYTSGSTGKPKGIVHTTAGYLLHTSLTHHYIFDMKDQDIFWCTADIGWVTGHSYIVYGPLCNGSTVLMFEGIPTYPDPDRFWQVVEKHHVSIFYTAPTALRALLRQGDSWPKKHNLSSLRLLGTVGEPINPEAWMWYRRVIGKEHCPVVDTWWQTETGGIMISPLPGAHTLKPGSASRPFFGVDPVILRSDGTECKPNEGGNLCIRKPWPGMMRTMWGDHKRFVNTYFTTNQDVYFTGDGARKDSDGDFWLLGRIDDVVNVSGHRIGTAEVESAFVSHPLVAEAAVVPIPHDVKGQALYAYVTLKDQGSTLKEEDIIKQLKEHVRKEIGPIATPETIQFTNSLPKTRSGKIMRRILRKIASNELEDLGDLSTLADPKVVDTLIRFRNG